MSDIIQFPYNKSFAYSTVILLSILLFIFIFRTFQFTDTSQIGIILCVDITFIILIAFIIVKYFIPAIKRKTALELNDSGIIDVIRHRAIKWDNVQSVRYVKFYGTFTTGIAVDLIDTNFFLTKQPAFQKILGRLNSPQFKTPLVIPLQYVSGDSEQVFQTIKVYLERRKNSA